jgi:DNA-binding CsgD family transcriptional regulator
VRRRYEAKRSKTRSGSRPRPKHPSLEPPLDLDARRFSLQGEEFVAFSIPLRKLTFPPGLSPAEREVAELVAAGLSNAEIAALRNTALRTVASQIACIFAKLEVGSRAELVTALAGSPKR